jgi:hypothetical protein
VATSTEPVRLDRPPPKLTGLDVEQVLNLSSPLVGEGLAVDQHERRNAAAGDHRARESATSTTRKIASIRTCQDEIAERARIATPGGRDAQFLAVLFEQPYCRIGTVAERCDVSRQTASSWLHALVEAGLLRDTKVGRELLFVNHEFLDVLTRPE